MSSSSAARRRFPPAALSASTINVRSRGARLAPPRGKEPAPPDDVGGLPHVAGPGVGGEPRFGVGLEAFRPPVLLCRLGQEGAGGRGGGCGARGGGGGGGGRGPGGGGGGEPAGPPLGAAPPGG